MIVTVPIVPVLALDPAPPIAELGIFHLFAWLYAYTLPPLIVTFPTPPAELYPIPPPIAVPVVVATAVTVPPLIVINP